MLPPNQLPALAVAVPPPRPRVECFPHSRRDARPPQASLVSIPSFPSLFSALAALAFQFFHPTQIFPLAKPGVTLPPPALLSSAPPPLHVLISPMLLAAGQFPLLPLPALIFSRAALPPPEPVPFPSPRCVPPGPSAHSSLLRPWPSTLPAAPHE